jgi:hypothetical protein
LVAAELENKETLELETQDNAMFAKLTLLKCIFLTPCTDCGDLISAQTANVKGQVAVITGSD